MPDQQRKSGAFCALCSYPFTRIEVFPTLAWLLAKFDEQPDRRTGKEYWNYHGIVTTETDLLIAYSQVIEQAILQIPAVSLDQINQMLDDFTRRLQYHGYSLRAAMLSRAWLYTELGKLDAAAQLVEEISFLERDDLAACEACERNELVCFAAERNDHAEAMKLAQPILNGALSCESIPALTYTTLMLTALQENDLELAKEMHLKGYPFIHDDHGLQRRPSLGVVVVAEHAIYLARVRDTSKGLDLIRKYLVHAMDNSSLGDRGYFFAGALAVTRLALETGATTLAVRLPESHPVFNANSPDKCDLRELTQWLEREFQSGVAAFDARNGTKTHSSMLQEWMSLAKV